MTKNVELDVAQATLSELVAGLSLTNDRNQLKNGSLRSLRFAVST